MQPSHGIDQRTTRWTAYEAAYSTESLLLTVKLTRVPSLDLDQLLALSLVHVFPGRVLLDGAVLPGLLVALLVDQVSQVVVVAVLIG